MLNNTKLMNMSEVDERNFKSKEETGWICPRCGKVLSPKEKTCTCTSTKQESAQETKNWIHD